MQNISFIYRIAPLGALALLVGCAGPAQKENLLSAAGFTREPANTPQRVSELQKLTPHELIQTDRDGHQIWIYADPTHCKCLYIGGQQEYQKYHNLKVRKNIAETKLDAAQLESTGWGWGAWGAYPGAYGYGAYGAYPGVMAY